MHINGDLLIWLALAFGLIWAFYKAIKEDL